MFYGISTTGAQNANATAYETGVGWVGITTYKDQHGTLRVKKEVLLQCLESRLATYLLSLMLSN